MRLFLFFMLLALGGPACADSAAEPLPPPDVAADSADQEPEITITQESGQKVEEYRANGRLYMIKVTPKHGHPYYLVDERGDGKFARQESLDSGFRVPRWVLFTF